MRLVLVMVLAVLPYVASKSNTKSLTESMGQEVIEIGTPLKDLPPDLEEEPSAEADETDKSTSTTLQAATPKEIRKDTTIEARRKLKDIKTDKEKEEDDDAKIERELAEMYKDNEYKEDNVEIVQDTPSTQVPLNGTEKPDSEKPVGRARDSFKFQPDRNNPREVEWFRTSVDDINCEKNRLAGVTKVSSSGHVPDISRIAFCGLFMLL